MGKGSKKIVTGYTYWGSYAGYICMGPVKRLHQVTNGDTVIWEGPIDSSSADVNGLTILNTTMGTIRFYWGTATQNPDVLLSTLTIDRGSGPELVPIPAFRQLCYYVADDISFGQQVVPPTLKFRYEVETSGLDIAAHQVESDAVLPEAIYQLLTNTLYGPAVDAGDIDIASFEVAADITITEGLVASPLIESIEQARELVGQMLAYIDASMYFDGGKLTMVLNRAEDPDGLATINEADLLEEPKPDLSQFLETWSRTLVTFRDRENKWEETPADYDDKANAVIQGRKKTRVRNFPWVTRREVAELLAAYIGSKNGLPAGFWRLTVMPSRKNLHVGQLVKLSYAKFGIVNRVVRIKSKTIKRPSDAVVELEVFEERGRDISNDYIPTSNNTIPGNTADLTLASTVPRLSWLPDELKADEVDGLLVAMERPSTGHSTGAEAWWTWNPTEQPYRLILAATTFPAKGELFSWHRIRTDSWLLRVSFPVEVDYDWMMTLQQEASELFAVVGVREFVTAPPKDQHQVMSPWLRVTPGGVFNLLSPTMIDIEVESTEWFQSGILELETAAAEGRYPTLHIYFGRREDFGIFPTSIVAFERNEGNAIDDAALLRYIKTPVSNEKNAQTLDDVTATTFDRNDPTMCPDGTLSREWGARAPTTYEIFDIEAGAELDGLASADYLDLEDIDEALGAIYGGTETADQTLLAEDIDDTLGAMVASGSDIYNESP